MRLILFITFCLFANFWGSYAWLAPERCAQNKNRRKRSNLLLSAAAPTDAGGVPTIEEIAAKQNENLKKTYGKHQFNGLAVRGEFNNGYSIHAPYNCSFHTYNPRALATVTCHGAACKLVHTVATVDTYTAMEGYNWGVKVSTKASFLEKSFEVGGEVSVGGTYSCATVGVRAYTKGRTTTETVECSAAAGRGDLQLYYFKSDMSCDFGKIELQKEDRDGDDRKLSYNFTVDELTEIYDSAAIKFQPTLQRVMIDPSKISDRLLQKLLKEIPRYNPYTDTVFPYIRPRGNSGPYVMVQYFKKVPNVHVYRQVIPFTNEAGDSVYQYACLYVAT